MMPGKQRWRRFSGVCRIANNLTPERFEHLVHQVTRDTQVAREVETRGGAVEEERSLGNMKFIRKLFKLQMVKENILQSCVGRLLKYLEAFPALDVEYAKMQMDRYFSYMNYSVKKKCTSMRVWFPPTELMGH